MRQFANDTSEAERQMALSCIRSNEISNSSFDFNLSMMTDRSCLELFRFNHANLNKIVPLLAWPEAKRRTTRNAYRTTPTIAACVLLRRLATPARWVDLEVLFGKFAAQLAEIFREALQLFLSAQGELLTGDIPQGFFSTNAERYSQRVYGKCLALENVVAFIDGTVLGIARPGGMDSNQRCVYNGHKRKHALKFQAITTPDGLCAHLYGPEVGGRHDMFLYAESDIERFLKDILVIEGRQYVVYGDSGYSVREFLEIPYSGGHMTAWESAFNKAMSKVRITVEWYFKEVKSLWSFVDCKRRLRVLQMPVGMMYQAAVLLTNFRNCLEPNEISQYFNCRPPNLQEYVEGRGG